MKKRFTTKKYMRDINKYNVKMFIGNDNFYVSVKEIIEVKEPFVLKNGLCAIDNGYYIVEVIPKNENYAMRAFINEKKEILEYYFDISLGNGLHEKTLVPYYQDLYLDVTIINGEIKILDEDELEEALKDGIIDMETYELAKNALDNLLKELREGTNRFVNMNILEYLD